MDSAPVYSYRKTELTAPSMAEVEIMDDLILGKRVSEIAIKRDVSAKTVENQIKSVRAKLGARNMHHLTAIWAKMSVEG